MREPILLAGCTPEPLMSYLKALGAFRLIAEQVDPDARLSWCGGVARLHTELTPEELTKFFLEEYRPTPIIGPWGARSGFYSGSSETSARHALETISANTLSRLDPFRRVIEAVRNLLKDSSVSAKEDLDKGDSYLRLLRDLRNILPDETSTDGAGAWLDAVYTIGDDRVFPPLLGTGGNEGSGSYMSNFCQLVAELIVNRKADQGIDSALFCTRAAVRTDVMVGHFAPSAIDGPNSSVGFSGGGGANPWDFLLAIEGTLLFRGAAARRMGTDTQGKAAFPFTVNPNPVGYGSAADTEDARAEIWMPEWPEPSTLPELKNLLNEGRVQLGRRQARNTVEFARAAVSLGVSRGLNAFHRYSLVKRNGLSYFAAHLGRFPVRKVPNVRLIDQLDSWLAPYRRLAEDDKAPPRFAAAVRRIDTAIYDVCRYGDSPQHMQNVLRAVGRAERELANSAKVRTDKPELRLRPLSGLSAHWLKACDDGSPEFRLAVSLATMPGRRGRHRPFRMYVEPVIPYGKSGSIFDDAAPGVVWSNTDLATNLATVLIRRLLDGAATPPSATLDAVDRSAHPLWAPLRFRPTLGDVLRFLNAGTNDDVIGDLLWALPAIDASDRDFRFGHSPSGQIPPADYAALKLVFLTESVTRPGSKVEVAVRNEPRTAALLRADRLDEALDVACRRLQASGLPPFLSAAIAGVMKPVCHFPRSPEQTRRLLAALLFPLRAKAVGCLVAFSIRELKPSTI
jgi:CRISPR-associated protein Csx17